MIIYIYMIINYLKNIIINIIIFFFFFFFFYKKRKTQKNCQGIHKVKINN